MTDLAAVEAALKDREIDVLVNCAGISGITNTPAIVLIATDKALKSVTLDGQEITSFTHGDGLLHIRFPNESRPRVLELAF